MYILYNMIYRATILPLPFPQPLLSITTMSYHHCYPHHYHTNSTHITVTIPASI